MLISPVTNHIYGWIFQIPSQDLNLGPLHKHSNLPLNHSQQDSDGNNLVGGNKSPSTQPFFNRKAWVYPTNKTTVVLLAHEPSRLQELAPRLGCVFYHWISRNCCRRYLTNKNPTFEWQERNPYGIYQWTGQHDAYPIQCYQIAESKVKRFHNVAARATTTQTILLY